MVDRSGNNSKLFEWLRVQLAGHGYKSFVQHNKVGSSLYCDIWRVTASGQVYFSGALVLVTPERSEILNALMDGLKQYREQEARDES